MAQSILQDFLNLQFINPEKDEDRDKLLLAAAELKKKWQKDKIKVLQATLVALDPDVFPEEYILSEVQQAVIAKWHTFITNVAKNNDKPVTYLRAVMLEALSLLSEDINIASLIWYTGRNVVRHYKLGRESELINNFILQIGKSVEKHTQISWQLVKTPSINMPENFEIKLPSDVTISQAAVEKHLKAATMYSGWGATMGGENPHVWWSNDQNWPKFLSERASKGLTAEINKAFSKQGEFYSVIQAALNTYLTGLKPYFEQVGANILQSSQSYIRRSQLLWWKEALYSTKLNKSYRELSPLLTAISMAADLASELPPIYPVSVDYLLKETIRDVLNGKADEEIGFSSLSQEIDMHVVELSELLPLVNVDEGRKLLSVHLKDSLRDKNFLNDLKIRTGIDSNTKVTYAELSAWVLHDIHSVKLATTK